MTDWLGTFLAISARREIGERLLQAEPAWVWSRDGSALAWANPAGARLLGLHTLEDLAAFSLSEKQNLRRDIVNVARTLGQGATLARLRFYQGARSLPLACHCERLRIGDGRTLILVTGSDVIGGGTPPDADELVAFLDGAKSLAGIGSATFVLDCDGRILARRGNAGAAPDFRGLTKPGDEARSAEIDGWSVRYVTVNGSGEPRILLWGDRLQEIETAVEPAKAEHHPDEEEAIEDDRVKPDAAEPGADETDAAEPDTGEPDAEALEGELQEQNLSEQARILRSAFRKPPGAEAEEIAAAGWPHALDNLPKKPVRFLWQTDADDRFLFVSPGLEQLVGRASDIVGERWNEIARRMRLDPVGRITEALAARDTWSGFTAWWPDTEHRARIPAELTALPVFALDQSFQGYRGFGVLKPAEALSEEAFDRRFPGNPAALPQTPPAAGIPRAPARVETRPEPSGNVVPIRHDIDRLPDFARLSPQERSAFEEIATALRTPHEAGRVETDGTIGEIVPSRASRAEPPVEADDALTEADEAKEAPEYSTDADDPAFLASLPDDDDGDYPPDVDEAYPEEFADLLDSEDGGEAESGDVQDEDLPDSGELAAPEPANDDELAESGPAAEDEEDDEGSGSDEQRELAAGDLAEDGDDHEDAGAGIDGADLESPDVEADESEADRDGEEGARRIAELTAILNTATDGVLTFDNAGRIESLNASAEALFGQDEQALAGTLFVDLLSEESRQSTLDYLDGLRENGVASVLNEGREVSAQSGEGAIPLFMTMGRISGSGADARFCAVVRDISQWKRTEAELIAGRTNAERASEQKSEFLARVSHEIRTPLNAIIGFAEVMIEERFGAVENDRYREYLRDIRTSGEHVVSLVNDLLDISKIEAGKLDLTFSAVPLNDLVRECVALMQPQANRAQVIVRSSLAVDLPAIVADPRTMRQIVLNLLSNSVKFTGSGGQVIISTTLADTGEAILRVRDTGSGMSEEDLARALEPFRQLSTSRIGDENGTGLGLPLTKALVESNRAEFAITSARGEGTIVQVTFPATRVLSE